MFEKGQKVCVVSYQQTPLKLCTVEKVMKRKLVLDDGSEWTWDGSRRWGMGAEEYYQGNSVRTEKPTDAEKVMKRRVRHWLQSVDWARVSRKTLIQVHKLLKSDLKGES